MGESLREILPGGNGAVKCYIGQMLWGKILHTVIRRWSLGLLCVFVSFVPYCLYVRGVTVNQNQNIYGPSTSLQ